jgi:hypothetical protein
MTTAILTLDSDILTANWPPVPSSPTTHYDKLNEWPHDASATYLEMLVAPDFERYGWDLSGVPYHPAHGNLRLRWVALTGSGTPALYTGRAGLFIGAAYYWGATQEFPGTFGEFGDDFPVDPSDGGAWTRAKLAVSWPAFNMLSIDLAPTKARLTALSPLLTLGEDPLERRVASAAAETRAATAARDSADDAEGG